MTSRAIVVSVAGALASAACGHGGSVPPPPSPPSPPSASEVAACVADLQARLAIDTSGDPRVCVPLRDAIASLGDDGAAVVRGMVVVRDAAGPCGDRCPDLAAQLMSDATLASYRFGQHQLHVMDAAFTGPRWRGGAADAPAVAAYLAALGVDEAGLIARVRALPGAALPADATAAGDPRVLDAIVRAGPRVLLGVDVPLVDVLRHELGHALQLHPDLGTGVDGFAALVGWRDADGELASGYISGAYAGERPIVASRLVLGLPRGDGDYVPTAGGQPTGYARFDPMEDFAECVRLAHADPAALAAASPARLLAAATPAVLADRAVRGAIAPGMRALLASADPEYAMAVVRRLGAALLPEAAPLADARPLPVPADATADERAEVERQRMVVTIDGHTFRPTDAVFLAAFAALRDNLRMLREFNAR